MPSALTRQTPFKTIGEAGPPIICHSRALSPPQESVSEISRKIEENRNLSADAKDAAARAQTAEALLEERMQDNARLKGELEKSRAEVKRCEEALSAAETREALHEGASVEREKQLQTLREEFTSTRHRLEVLGDSLKNSDDRVNEAKVRVREMEQVITIAAILSSGWGWVEQPGEWLIRHTQQARYGVVACDLRGCSDYNAKQPLGKIK